MLSKYWSAHSAFLRFSFSFGFEKFISLAPDIANRQRRRRKSIFIHIESGARGHGLGHSSKFRTHAIFFWLKKFNGKNCLRIVWQKTKRELAIHTKRSELTHMQNSWLSHSGELSHSEEFPSRSNAERNYDNGSKQQTLCVALCVCVCVALR